jgi:hypothetical protein
MDCQIPYGSRYENKALAGLGICCPGICVCVVGWGLLALRCSDSRRSVSGGDRRRTLREQEAQLEPFNGWR